MSAKTDNGTERKLDHSNLLLHFTANGNFAPGGDANAAGANDLLVLERGEGPYVFDTHGRRYFDGLSSLFCAQIGYSYGEEFAVAAATQLNTLAFNTNWGTAHPPSIELANQLAELAPEGIDRVFFTNGGSESVEAALKLVRQYHVANGEPQRVKAIARKTAYHGVTLGALSLTGVPAYKDIFWPAAVPTRHVSNTNRYRLDISEEEHCRLLLDELEQTIQEEGPETVAVFVAEPIQNAGGAIPPPAGYFEGVRKICDRYGILLHCDEVISGFGRIGEWFASTRFGAKPDLITVAKGITSAYAPMGAVLVSSRVAEHLYEPGKALLHGITFGGHPLSAAIALKNLEIFKRDGVLENVRAVEPHLEARLRELRELPIVGDVRGAGFFWAVEMIRPGGPDQGRFDQAERDRLIRGYMPAKLLDVGLIARADDRGDSVVVVAPPLISTPEQIDEMVEKLAQALEGAGKEMGLADMATSTGGV
jgi:adenosylmethionine-8-amino-7-oxononanoate aminotransferase